MTPFRSTDPANQQNFITYFNGMGDLNLASLTTEVMSYVNNGYRLDYDVSETEIMSDED
jgi:hypothetical protein